MRALCVPGPLQRSRVWTSTISSLFLDQVQREGEATKHLFQLGVIPPGPVPSSPVPSEPSNLGVRERPFCHLLYVSLKEPLKEGTGSDSILHCGVGGLGAGGERGSGGALRPQALASLTTAASAGRQSHALEADSPSALSGRGGLRVPRPGQDGPAQRLHGCQAPQGRARP